MAGGADNDDNDGDDGIFAVYNAQLAELSGRAAVDRPLEEYDARAHVVSPICGSEVTVQIRRDAQGRVTDFGYEVEACALTRAVVGVMQEAIKGKSREEIARAGAELEALLEGRPVVPSGDWADLLVLAPLKDYRARHNAMLLPFEAVDKAFAALA